MPVDNDDTRVVMAQDPDQGPPGDSFKAMVDKVEQGMKEWEQSRFKPKQDENQAKDKTEKEKAGATDGAGNAEAGAAAAEGRPDKEAAGRSAETGSGSEAGGHTKPADGDGDGGVPGKEEKEAAEEPVPAVIKSKKAADEFRNLKRTMQERINAKQAEILGLKKQISQQQQAPAKVEPPPELVKQLDELRAEREELISRIERANLEASPRFQQKYSGEFNVIEAMAKDAAGEHSEKVLGLLKLPPSKARKEALGAVMSELDPVDQGQLSNAFARMDMVRAARDSELANHRDIVRQEMLQQEMARQQQEEISTAKKQFLKEQVLKAAVQFEAFQQIDGDNEHNAEAEAYMKEISDFFDGKIDETAAAFMPILAAEGQYLKTKKVPALEKKIEEQAAIIAEMTDSNPKTGVAKKGEKPGEKRPKGFAEAFMDNYPGKNFGE